jgi:actin-related protein
MIQFSEAMNKTPLIIDNGSGYIKAGSAGDERPKLIMPN